MRFLLILLLASNLLATEYFVSPSGDDFNSGTETAPFASIQRGIDQLRSGDTLSIVSGTYAPTSKLSIYTSGTAEAPILIRGVGETPPVIDASNYNDKWPHGFEIGAPYVRLENIHVKNAKKNENDASYGNGISVWNTHNVTISRCIVSGNYGTGIGIQSDSLRGTRAVVVEECEVFNNVLMNAEKTMDRGWGSGIGAGHCSNITFRNNLVYENYGEGLLTYLSDSVTMTGNVSKDNFSVSLYVDNGTNVVIQNNFAYSTGNSNFYRDNFPASGFQIANESYTSVNPSFVNPSRNVIVQNNLFVNQRSALYYGNYGAGGGLKEFRYRYNTAWNSFKVSVEIADDEHEDVVIEGNIFVQSDNLPHFDNNGSPELITARNNLWFGGTGPYLDGEGNVFADPLLPGGGEFDPAGYVPSINSPAVGSGGEAEGVAVDFFDNARSAPFDIGAFTAGGTGGGVPPSVPALVSPTDNSTDAALTPALSWNVSSTALDYRVQVATDEDFTTLILDQSAVSDLSLTVSPDLSPNTRYYWRVNAQNAGGTSDWSEVWSFTTLPEAPAVPALVSPGDGLGDQVLSLFLAWDSVGGSVSYHVQLSTDASFTTLVSEDSTLTGTSLGVGPLNTATTYYWRVRAGNTGGVSDWSTVWSFITVPEVPVAPVLATPFTGGTDQALNPTLIWNLSGGAATYRLQVSTDSSFASTMFDDSTLADTSLALDSLVSATTYYWRVSAQNSGGTSDWSEVWSFTTLPEAPAALTLVSPSDEAGDQSLSLSLVWGSVESITTYWLQVSTSEAFDAQVFDDSTLTDTAQAMEELAFATTYYWRVNAQNAGGTSDWSEVWSFTTLPEAPAVPALVSPGDGLGDQTLSLFLGWDSVGGAINYHVQLSIDASFTTLVSEESTLTVTLLGVGPLNTATTYYWRVRAGNTGGVSDWSEVWSFITLPGSPSTPALNSPSIGGTDQALNPTLVWNPSGGTADYRLQVSTDSSFASTTFDDSTLADTSLALDSLVSATTYYWRVNAQNAGGTSDWSEVWSFTTITPVGLLPREFSLERFGHGQGYLRFALPQRAQVRVRLLDSRGRTAVLVLDEVREAGEHRLAMPRVAGGFYLIDFQAGEFRRTLRMGR